MFNNHFKFNLKSLFLITMVVFCAGLFTVNVGTANASVSYDGTKIIISDGVENLTTINDALNNPLFLEQLSPKEWLLKVPMEVRGAAGGLHITGLDCDLLKMKGLPTLITIGVRNGGSILIENTNIWGWDTGTNTDISLNDNSPTIDSWYNNSLNAANTYFKHVGIRYRYDETPNTVDNCTFFECNPRGIGHHLSLYKTITHNQFIDCYLNSYSETNWDGVSENIYTYTNFSHNYCIGHEGYSIKSDNVQIGSGSTIIGNEIIHGGWNILNRNGDSLLIDNIIHDNGGNHNGFNPGGAKAGNIVHINDYAYNIDTYSGFFYQYSFGIDYVPHNIRMINCKAENCSSGNGFLARQMENSYLYNFTSINNGGNTQQYNAKNITYERCSISGCSAYYGMYFIDKDSEGYPDDCMFINSKFNNNWYDIGMGFDNFHGNIYSINTYNEVSMDAPTVRWSGPKGEFRDYVWLDVLVQDQDGTPIPDATVTIESLKDINYSALDIVTVESFLDLDAIINRIDWGESMLLPSKQDLTSITASSNGHTPLPEEGHAIALMFQKRISSETTDGYNYKITAEKDGYTNTMTVNPNSSWYRSDPNTYQNTVTIVLDVTGTPDTTPPTITSHSPSEIDVAVDTNISVDFSELMNQSSAQNAFSISPNVSGSFIWSSNQMIFNPSSDLSNETTYTVNISTIAEDLAGNNLESPYTWNFTTIAETPPDTTPPVRSNGSPSGNLAYGTTQTTISLTTDENATCKYGTIVGISYGSLPNIFSTTGTTSHSTIVSGLSNGNIYTYYVRCIDTSSNANTNDYSITFSIDTEPQAGGLVGHWKFNEGTGTIATDSSGYNNNGILINMEPATDWVDGQVGGALDFDGSNDYVDVADSAIFDITAAITVEAWLKPTGNTSDDGIITKKSVSLPYFSYGLKGFGNKFVGVIDSTGGDIYCNANTTYTTGQWYHVVLTYDGTTAKLYIDAAKQIDEESISGTITTSNYNLYLGSWSESSYCSSVIIDDVRIYSRTLTAEEVLAHYNEGNEPEINHDPIGNLDTANQSQINGWAYDQNAGTNPIDVHIYIDGNLIGSSTANESRPDLVEAGVTPDPNHGFSFSTPSLSIGEHTVSVYAINSPEGTNPELIGSPMTFTVSSSDTTPPTGSIQINSGNQKTNSQNVSLTISASDPSGLSEMKISNSNDFSSAAAEVYNTVKTFILSPIDGLKTVYIWFKDNIGNWNITPYSDTITLDTTPPTISNISISNITTSTATISFKTNEDSYSHLEYGTSVAYGFQLPANSELKTDYSISIIGLGSNTEYHFRVVSKDALENESNSIDQTFKTIGNPDTIPPSKITDLSSSNITQTSADLLWTSKGDDGNNGTAAEYDLRYSPNQISDSSILTEKNNWWDNSTQLTGEPIPSSSGTEEYVSVGLSSNTNYYFIIKSADEVPNWSDYSNILSLKTLAVSIPPPSGGGGGTVSDITPPSQPINFTATPADSQIFLTWTNPTDSDFVRVLILRKENSAPTSHNDTLATIIYEGNKEQYTDINLNNNTTYYYSIFAYDKKPNYSKILSLSSKPEKGKTSIEISNETYPEGTLLKTPDSFKIYIIINQKKKWIPTPEVFETLGYQWTEIIEIDKNELTLIPDYEDNLIRAINDFKVYLIVNGIKRHIPNPEIFINYGFEWNEVKDVNQETINQYTQANLIKESKKEEIYYLCSTRKIKRWLRSPEIFNSYPDNDWNNIQVISKYEMDHYPTSNLIKLIGDNNVYLIENNRKRLINSVEEFKKEGLDWGKVMGVGEVEFEWFGNL